MVSDAMRIRVIRAILDVSKKEFAEQMEVNVNTVRNWEDGSNIPQRKPRARLAEICEQNHITLRSDGFPVPVSE